MKSRTCSRSRAALSSVAPVLWWLGGGAARLAGLPQGCPVRQPLRVTALWLASKAVVVANAQLTEAAMADITPFNFGIFTVRVINRDNQPWFVANDICNALGYSNTSKAIGDHLDEDERMTVTASDGQSFDSNQPLESFSKGVASSDTLRNRGGARHLVIINESGLYALVLRSRKPEARKFAKWVTREVLPSIRQTGGHGQPAQDAHQLAH